MHHKELQSYKGCAFWYFPDENHYEYQGAIYYGSIGLVRLKHEIDSSESVVQNTVIDELNVGDEVEVTFKAKVADDRGSYIYVDVMGSDFTHALKKENSDTYKIIVIQKMPENWPPVAGDVWANVITHNEYFVTPGDMALVTKSAISEKTYTYEQTFPIPKNWELKYRKNSK